MRLRPTDLIYINSWHLFCILTGLKCCASGCKLPRASRQRFRDDAAHRSGMMPPTIPGWNRHVRFDERGWETGRCRTAQATAPIFDSTEPPVRGGVAQRPQRRRSRRSAQLTQPAPGSRPDLSDTDQAHTSTTWMCYLLSFTALVLRLLGRRSRGGVDFVMLVGNLHPLAQHFNPVKGKIGAKELI